MTGTGTDVAENANRMRCMMPKKVKADNEHSGLRVRPARKLATRRLQDQESAADIDAAFRAASGAEFLESNQETDIEQPFAPTEEDEKNLDDYWNRQFSENSKNQSEIE